jgi:hypothetical protein
MKATAKRMGALVALGWIGVLVMAAVAQGAEPAGGGAVTQPSIFWRNGEWQTFHNGEWRPYRGEKAETESGAMEGTHQAGTTHQTGSAVGRAGSEKRSMANHHTKTAAALSTKTVGNIGQRTIGIGQNTIAIGENNTGIGQRTIGIGQNTIGIGENNTSIGQTTIGMGQNTIAIGQNNTSIGQRTIGIGQPNSGFGERNGMGQTTIGIGQPMGGMGERNTGIAPRGR